MKELVITVTPDTTPATLLQELREGTVVLHTERSNGTFRRVHYLAEGTEAREMAEFILALREGNDEENRAPMSMKAIAAKLHISIPSIRRMINDLKLTNEMEEMDLSEIDELLNGGVEVEDTMVVTEGDDE